MNIHPFPNAVNYFLRYYFIPLKKYTTLLIFYSALPQLRLQNFNRARNCTKFVTYHIRSVVYFYLYVYEKPSDLSYSPASNNSIASLNNSFCSIFSLNYFALPTVSFVYSSNNSAHCFTMSV